MSSDLIPRPLASSNPPKIRLDRFPGACAVLADIGVQTDKARVPARPSAIREFMARARAALRMVVR